MSELLIERATSRRESPPGEPIRNVEAAMIHVERTTALLTLLSRALSHTDDLCLSSEVEKAAYSYLSDLCAEAFYDVVEMQHALPFEALMVTLRADATEGGE